MASFLEFMVSLNCYFLFLFACLRCYSSSLCSFRTSDKRVRNCSRVISSNSPMETCSISCFGCAFVFFSNSRISWINSFLFAISSFYYCFFFSSIRLRSSFYSSWILRFFSAIFCFYNSIFSLLICTYSITFFLLYKLYCYRSYLSARNSSAISLISSTNALFS